MKIEHEKGFDPFKGIRESDLFKIDVKLYDEDSDSTRTRFYFNGEMRGFGVEDEYRDKKVHGDTRIDNGIYPLDTRFSPKFSKEYYRDDDGNLIRASKRKTDKEKERFHTMHELIWIKETPRHDLCLIHWGNHEGNTDGCYCVGTFPAIFKGGRTGTRLGVGASRKKYEEIYPVIWRALKKDNKKGYMNFDR